jgi:acyl-CoA reductase-like NAD-dependent aldehyde dehydrogenase
VPKATLEEVRATFAQAHAAHPQLSRFERAAILNKAAAIIQQRLQEVAT